MTATAVMGTGRGRTRYAPAVNCPACGTLNDAGRKFCGECGSRLTAICASCGAANSPSARFCGDCGSRLSLDAGSEPVAGVAPARPGRRRRRPIARTSLPAPVAERRLVTVLFADLVGFTALADGRDAEAVRELLTRYFEMARDDRSTATAARSRSSSATR